jgi:hypothetical protein
MVILSDDGNLLDVKRSCTPQIGIALKSTDCTKRSPAHPNAKKKSMKDLVHPNYAGQGDNRCLRRSRSRLFVVC